MIVFNQLTIGEIPKPTFETRIFHKNASRKAKQTYLFIFGIKLITFAYSKSYKRPW